jgi:peptide/nickel transport system substrate-binding protein
MRRLVIALSAVAAVHQTKAEDLLVVQGLAGKPGGRLAYAMRTEPRTLNPIMVSDVASREVVHRMIGDLIHINRETQQTEPALAKSWTVSADGRHYTLELRNGVRFSDGAPFDADDVVFSFQAVLDEKTGSPQRDLLILDGKPIAVRKLGPYRVVFDLPSPYAAAERLFDGFAILPRHLLEAAYREGKLAQAWSLGAAPSAVAGLGPFRLKEYVPGQRIVLEKNPYYWKSDKAGDRLPYLTEIGYSIAASEDLQVLRFESGESDLISRPSAKNFAALQKEQRRKGYTLRSLGPGLEYNFLFFNLNDLSRFNLAEVSAHQRFFRRASFREAVSLGIDRDALARLVFQGHATPLTSPVPLGNRLWVNAALPKPVRSVAQARQLLASDGFKWSTDGALSDPEGDRVEFSILTSASNADRVQMATLIQADLKELGMDVHVAPLEARSLQDRWQKTRNFDACLISLAEGDADPNPDMNVWLSSGDLHLWNPGQKAPATPWEAEIDGLMQRQMVTRDRTERKRLFDRVQQIAMDQLPIVPLLSPDILVGAKNGLGGFRPAVMDNYVLWNADELYWQSGSGGAKK